MMGWGEFGGFGFMGILWFLIMAAFWVLIAVGILLVIRALTSGDRQRTTNPPATGDGRTAVPSITGFSGNAPQSDALRILEERYARGDIDRDEFLQCKADLGS